MPQLATNRILSFGEHVSLSATHRTRLPLALPCAFHRKRILANCVPSRLLFFIFLRREAHEIVDWNMTLYSFLICFHHCAWIFVSLLLSKPVEPTSRCRVGHIANTGRSQPCCSCPQGDHIRGGRHGELGATTKCSSGRIKPPVNCSPAPAHALDRLQVFKLHDDAPLQGTKKRSWLFSYHRPRSTDRMSHVGRW